MLHLYKRYISVCAVAIKRYISMRVAMSLVRLRWETRGYLYFCPLNLRHPGGQLSSGLFVFFSSGIMSEELPIPIRNLAGVLIHKFSIA